MAEDTTQVMPELLLVEDNPLHVRLVRTMLDEIWSESGSLALVRRLGDALAHIDEHRPQIVLLDLNLPDAEGLVALHAIREHAPGVPIVVLSAHDDEKTALDAINSGAQDYLVKGVVTAEGLSRAIRYGIERARSVSPDPVVPAPAPNGEHRRVVAILDIDGRIVRAEQDFATAIGRSLDDVIFADPVNWLVGDSAASWSEALRITRVGESNRTSATVTISRPGRSSLTADIEVALLRDQYGSPAGFAATAAVDVRAMDRAVSLTA